MHRVVPLSLLALGLLNHPQAQAQRAFFRSPPTRVSLHNPASIEGERNRTTISITLLQLSIGGPMPSGRALSRGRPQRCSPTGMLMCRSA